MDECDSDEDLEFEREHQQRAKDLNLPPVELGYAEPISDQIQRQRLASWHFPLGKIGGKPAWLAYKPLPTCEQLICQTCSKPMCFLLQLYAPLSQPPSAFHRSFFVFVCRQATCSQTNSAMNFVVFRCQLPRDNDFYASEVAPDPENEPEFRPKKTIADFSTLCELCGCLGDKRCGRCERVRYCCRDHQAIHWKLAHKTECMSAAADANATTDAHTMTNSWLFKEYELVTETEELVETSSEDVEKSDEAKMNEYRQYVNETTATQMETDGIEETDIGVEDMVPKQDKTFRRFRNVLQQNAEQVLRYQRNGDPLLAAATAPDDSPTIPPCPNCGSARQFEFQIMPHLLELLGVDSLDHSLDWATLLVYSCAASCDTNNAYVIEYMRKQDYE